MHFESVLLLWLDLLEGSLGLWVCFWEYSQQKMVKVFCRRGAQLGSCRWFQMVRQSEEEREGLEDGFM